MKATHYAALAALFAFAAGTTPNVSAQGSSAYPGFTCVRLAQRQPLPGMLGPTFRVQKMTFTSPAFKPEQHEHQGAEIIYLLSGHGTNTMNGETTPLSTSSAIIIPPGTQHSIVPQQGSTLTVLSVQFANKPGAIYRPKTKIPSVCQD